MKPPAPPRVDDHYKHWGDEPPERSPRCTWWVARIDGGWRPNRRITCEGYDASSAYYGVYIWEYMHVIAPLLDKLTKTSGQPEERAASGRPSSGNQSGLAGGNSAPDTYSCQDGPQVSEPCGTCDWCSEQRKA